MLIILMYLTNISPVKKDIEGYINSHLAENWHECCEPYYTQLSIIHINLKCGTKFIQVKCCIVRFFEFSS